MPHSHYKTIILMMNVAFNMWPKRWWTSSVPHQENTISHLPTKFGSYDKRRVLNYSTYLLNFNHRKSNEHLKFHFRVNFTKLRFWPLRSEARAKIFTVLITWLGLVNFANLCHLGTSKGFRAVRVPWSEPDHHASHKLFEIWLW